MTPASDQPPSVCESVPDPTVITETHDGVALLILNRPDADNTLTKDLLVALRDALIRIEGDPRAVALVITGAGMHFSLGGDQGDFRTTISLSLDSAKSYYRERTVLLEDVIQKIYEMPVPTIAAVNGQAAGAGFSLALACDFRIVTRRTKLNFAYATLGLPTDGGMSWFLPRIVGTTTARSLLLRQNVIRSDDAERMGLTEATVAQSDLVNHALQLGSSFRDSARYPIRCAKQMIQLAARSTLAEHLHAEHQLFEDGIFQPEFAHALQAKERSEIPRFADLH